MATDDATFADRLDRFLDALAEGTDRSPNGWPQPEHEMVDTVRRLSAIDDAPTADPRFANRLLEEIMPTVNIMQPSAFPPLPPLLSLPAQRGRPNLGPARPRLTIPRTRWVLAQLATAALLVLALGAVYFTLVARPQRSVVPAVFVAASPTAEAQLPSEVTVAPLVAAMLLPEELPTEPPLYLQISHGTIAPGAQVAFTANMIRCCLGPTVDYVLAGEVTLRSEGPVRVVRAAADGTPEPAEEVPAETEVILRSGDSVLSRAEFPFTYINAGSEPVDIVSGALIHGYSTAQPTGYQVNNDGSALVDPALVTGPVSFVLAQTTLPPGGVLPAPPPGATRGIVSWPQIALLKQSSDGSVTNIEQDPVVVYVLTLVPGGTENGTAAIPTP
jgi:hypothetical protein